MYRNLAKKTTAYLISNQIIKATDEDIYIYSIQVLFSIIVYGLVFLLISLLTNTFLPSLIFFILFFITRKCAGGYHAPSYFLCHIIFATVHLAFICAFKFIPQDFFRIITLSMSIVSFILILALAPVEHKNNPISDKKRSRYSLICKILSVIILFISMLSEFTVLLPYVFSAIFGAFVASISLIFGIIKEGS